MVITNRNKDVKDLLDRVGSMCSNAESILNLCMLGFMKHKLALIEDAKKISKTVHSEENELLDLLRELANKQDVDKSIVKSLITVISHIEMATDVMDGMVRHIAVKIKDGTLFGNKAVNEVRHLFKETLDVIKTAGDAILTRNEVLKNHIDHKCKTIEQTVIKYSEEHEERLVAGVCQPKSASVYLNIVDSQMKVVWHIKQAIDRYFEKR